MTVDIVGGTVPSAGLITFDVQMVGANGATGDDALVAQTEPQAIDLVGSPGDETLVGTDGVIEHIQGLDGDDRIDGGSGPDLMAGGLGDDVYVVDDGGDQVLEPVSPLRLLSANSLGYAGNGNSFGAAMSADGGLLVFTSYAGDLVPTDYNGCRDVFALDMRTGAVQCVSTDASGQSGTGESFSPSCSADGRFVAFSTNAANLVFRAGQGGIQVLVRDLESGAIESVSVTADGMLGNRASDSASFSADGRYVVFDSYASNLVAGDGNGQRDVFVKDRLTGALQRASVDTEGTGANGPSWNGGCSADGRFVVFDSLANNLMAGDSNRGGDIFVKDLVTGVLRCASVDAAGIQGNRYSSDPGISADGRYVVFESAAGNLVPNDVNGAVDIFVKDLLTGAVQRASTDAGGSEANGASGAASMSADGRYVVFHSYADNLVAGDSNHSPDVFVKDLHTGALRLVSADAAGGQGNAGSYHAGISADGRYVIFSSYANVFADGDRNGSSDVFGAANPLLVVDSGIDTIESAVGYALPDGVEILALTGDAAIGGSGNRGANILIGNAAGNVLDGKAGDDVLRGGLGNDTYLVDDPGDVVEETSPLFDEIDTVRARVSHTLADHVEHLVLQGNDRIHGTGNALDNLLKGNAASNVLDGGSGADHMIGGSGRDTYVVDDARDVVVETSPAPEEVDVVRSSISWTLGVNQEWLLLTDMAAIRGCGNGGNNSIIGNPSDNQLVGMDGNDQLRGGVGADELLGGRGDDSLDGGTGVDRLVGGTGNDLYWVDELGDVVSETSPLLTEIDTVLSAVTFTLDANLEILRLTGTAATDGYGNGRDNILSGNAGNNVLYGMGGNDLLYGGSGADRLLGGFGNDTYHVLGNHIPQIVESSPSASEIDTVESGMSFTLGANLENLLLLSDGPVHHPIHGTGNALDNVLIGNNAANYLKGLRGDDSLSGRGGRDILSGGLGCDSLTGGAGEDAFFFDTPANAVDNLDLIVDFVSGGDLIRLDHRVFAALGTTGFFAADDPRFHLGAAAHDADDRIVYDGATGALYYDADGDGAVAAIQFATLGGDVPQSLVAADVQVI